MLDIEEYEEPLFDEIKMLRLVEKDKYLKFVFTDMIGKGQTEAEALLFLFNSNVLGDSAYTDLYATCNSET